MARIFPSPHPIKRARGKASSVCIVENYSEILKLNLKRKQIAGFSCCWKSFGTMRSLRNLIEIGWRVNTVYFNFMLSLYIHIKQPHVNIFENVLAL